MNIYRKRFEPNECILLADDKIIYSDTSYIFTKWETLKPRDDFNNGVSIYDIDNGVKISKFFKDETLIYYYIDIIGMEYSKDDDTYVCTDYVLDVVLQSDLETYEVLDEDELERLIEKGVFTVQDIVDIRTKLAFITQCIENKNFISYLNLFENAGL